MVKKKKKKPKVGSAPTHITLKVKGQVRFVN